MNRHLKLAVIIAFGLHAALILAARYRWSYDAYVHMFFADHYRQAWWSLWEPRWYGGFSVVSYPPLVHQLIALLSHVAGLEGAFALVLLTVTTLLPVAMYVFARIFAGRIVSGWSAILSAIVPSVYLTAYTFGQLPTLAGLVAALLLFAAIAAFLKRGHWLTLLLVLFLAATTAALHHGTLLLLPWGFAAVTAHLLLTRQVTLREIILRVSLLLLTLALGVLIVVWPFWQWGMSEQMQVPIDHLSRHSFLFNPRAQLLFFWPVYGPLVACIPFVARRLFRKRSASLAGLFLFLFVLGLGGTTPLPRILFGARWAWLTYDRFALWASIVMLPLAVEALALGYRAYRQLAWGKMWRFGLPKFQSVVMVAFLVVAMIAAFLPSIVPTQPAQIDLRPVAAFLNRPENAGWRYLTFGLGDQMARLSVLTRASTIDGSYHTARWMPELRNSGIGQIDSAYWMPAGLQKLEPVLEKSTAYGVRWAFVNLPAYKTLLKDRGWAAVTTLSDGVQVFENLSARFPSPLAPVHQNPLAALSWGILPLLALSGSLTLGLTFILSRSRAMNPAKYAARVSHLKSILVLALLGLHQICIGLLPLAICFPYFRRLFPTEHSHVYFTYDNPLIYLSDVVILAAMAAWVMAWILKPHAFLQRGPRAVTWVLLALVGLAWTSLASSSYPTGSIYTGVHFGLVLGLYLSLLDHPKSWVAFSIGSVAALGVESSIAVAEFALQSTAFLLPLGLEWPGALVPGIRGASVVELLGGTRWLRAYGTLPHPNMLGGVILACLAALVAFFLALPRTSKERPQAGKATQEIISPPSNRSKQLLTWLAGGLFALGVAGLVLSFSRSAWIGFLTGAVTLALLPVRLPKLQLWRLLGFTGVALSLTVIPFRSLVYTRVAALPVHTEIRSISERLQQTDQALAVIEQRPLGGTGIGGYLVTLAKETPGDWWVEPVHNMYLLATAELGLPGALLMAALVAAILANVRRARTPDAAALSAAVLGLLIIGLFDHYLWSLATGRALLWSMLGVWAGQLSLADRKEAAW